MTDVVLTVLAAASTYDLTDLATVKDELSLTDTTNDAWISRSITQVSKSVMSATNRVFAPEYVQDAFDITRQPSQVPTGLRGLQLSRWPILSIASVVQSSGETGTPVTLVAGTDFEVDYANGLLLRLNSESGTVMGWEPMPTTVKYTAGYGAAVSETHTVPGTPYQVTVAGAATFSCDQAVTYNGATFDRVASNPAASQYTVSGAGLYTFNPTDTGKSLAFAYCTRDIPDDLVDAALRLVTGRFNARGRDPALIQREQPGMGVERWWFGGAPGQQGAFAPDIQAMLDNYTVPTVA